MTINSKCLGNQSIIVRQVLLADGISIGALTLSPPMFSPSENATQMVGPSDSWTLELSDPHLFGACIV